MVIICLISFVQRFQLFYSSLLTRATIFIHCGARFIPPFVVIQPDVTDTHTQRPVFFFLYCKKSAYTSRTRTVRYYSRALAELPAAIILHHSRPVLPTIRLIGSHGGLSASLFFLLFSLAFSCTTAVSIAWKVIGALLLSNIIPWKFT